MTRKKLNKQSTAHKSSTVEREQVQGERNSLPPSTAKRLPLYYRTLGNLREAGIKRISSSQLSEAVKIDAATIRRDLSYLGALGKKGYGYHVEHLISFLQKLLQQNQETPVIIIGAGNLGTALINYHQQKKNPIYITKAFDVNQEKIGHNISGVHVYGLEDLNHAFIAPCEIAILAVPAQAAQEVADLLVQAGIEAILNFTPARIDVPEHVLLHHIDLGIELQTLVYFHINRHAVN